MFEGFQNSKRPFVKSSQVKPYDTPLGASALHNQHEVHQHACAVAAMAPAKTLDHLLNSKIEFERRVNMYIGNIAALIDDANQSSLRPCANKSR